MARIYNFMPAPILVVAGTVFIPTGGITIAPGQRSDSLSWPGTTTLTVWESGGGFVCTFNFGVHAQIQGGNYAVIQPGSYLVYDSNHEVIATGG